MKNKNYNIRFNMEKEDECRAYRGRGGKESDIQPSSAFWDVYGTDAGFPVIRSYGGISGGAGRHGVRPFPIKTVATAERPSYPKPSILASKYPRMKEIEGRLKEQNNAIWGREKKRDMLKKELSECTTSSKAADVRNCSRRLTVLTSSKEFNAAKRESMDYEAGTSDKTERSRGEIKCFLICWNN